MPIISNNVVFPSSAVNLSQWNIDVNQKTGLQQVLTDSKQLFNPGQTSRTGWKDTDWRVKVKKQQNAALAYQINKFVHVVPWRIRAGSTYYNTTEKAWHTGTLVRRGLLGVPIGTTSDSVTRDIALARFKRKLQGSIGNAKLLVPTVELRELHKSIRASTHLASDLVTALIRARKTRGRSLLRFYQDTWLAFSFGISPLIGDTMKAIESINNFHHRPRTLKRIHGSATRSWLSGSNSTISSGTNAPIGHNTWVHESITHTLEYNFDAAVDFNLLCGNDYGIASHLGLSEIPRQLPSLGWELFPFSWVFDYFTTVGAYLEDTFVLPPGSTLYLTESQHYRAKSHVTPYIQPSASPLPGRYLTFMKTEDGYWEYMFFRRQVLTNLPHRSLRFKTVDEVGSSAVNKLLNLTALLGRRN